MKKTKKIALAGISCAFSAVFIILGNYFNVLDYSCYMLASLCLVMPFITGEIKWSILCFIASTVIGGIFAPNFLTMLPFLAFFAPYVLIHCIAKQKGAKKAVELAIKEIFYAISIVVMYFFSTFFTEINEWNLPLWTLIVGAFVIMNVYDFLMGRIIVYALRLVNKYYTKV